jgi:hypothetical protein
MTALETRLNRFVSRCKSALKNSPRSLRVVKAMIAAGAPQAPASGPTIGVFTKEMLRLHRTAAKRQGVEPDIHPKDLIYWYLVNSWERIDVQINYYFEDGGRSATKVAELAAEMGYDGQRKIKLLEFASGYGCVSRHLKKIPQFDLVSCDIHPEAIDFLTRKIGVKAILSAHVPDHFSPPQKYDIVFALSFFTHLPRSSWGRWLKVLYNTVEAPGYLMFTTHGQTVLEMLKPTGLSDDGFGFSAESEQKDLDPEEYGSNITMPEFVHAQIVQQLGQVEVIHRPTEWWKFQDLWIIRRDK